MKDKFLDNIDLNTVDYIHKLGEKQKTRYQKVKEHQPGHFTTSPMQLDMGICVCDECGSLCSTDYKWCDPCKRFIIIINSSVIKKQNAKKRRMENKLINQHGKNTR